MYVCICRAICDRTIREAIKNGATSVKAVTAQLPIGKNCAKCVGDIEALITETLLQKTDYDDSAHSRKALP